ncbi:hypothetical protein ACFQ10_20695 [Streptomyces indonesiensis]
MGPSGFSEVGRFLTLDPFARKRLAEADEALGYSVFDRLRDSEDDYSEATQIAFLVNSMASADRAEQEHGLVPDLCVGPSFGQKAAAAYVSSLPFPEVVRLTAELARCEHAYFAEEYQDAVTHTFVRTPQEKLTEILTELGERGEWYDYSGYLDDGFFMVSLREPELEWFKKAISQAAATPCTAWSRRCTRPRSRSCGAGPPRRSCPGTTSSTPSCPWSPTRTAPS